MAEWIRTMILSTKGTQIGSIKTPILPTPAAQTMIYVITSSRITTKIADIDFLNLSWYLPRNAYVHFPEILGTCYGTDTEQIRTYSWKLMTVILEQIRCFDYEFSMDFGDCISEFLLSRNMFPVQLNLLYGAFPETISRHCPNMIPETKQNTSKLCLVFRG